MHYSDAWTAWLLASPASGLFVQQPVSANIKQLSSVRITGLFKGGIVLSEAAWM